MKNIETEWEDIQFAVTEGPATWEDWIEMGLKEK